MNANAILPLIISLGMLTYTVSDVLPLKEWKGNKSTYVFYLSGDGGMNAFSNGLCTELNRHGYTVSALDSKSYFWKKKEPAQASKEIAKKIETEISSGKYSHFVVIGYSFGADVAPFIVNLFPPDIRNKLSGVVLISPSESTDFEIHLLDLLGKKQKEGMNVPEAINRLQVSKTTVILGKTETGFNLKSLTLPNLKTFTLPGGHHYNDDTKALARAILSGL